MSSIPRRKLEELVLLYELDSSRIDIFVEGAFDVSIFRWLIRESNHSELSVYEISTIEIPDNELIEKGKKVNNRERLVFLAEYFEDKTKVNHQIFCFIDADFSHILKSFENLSRLIFTDYSCMEMYFYNETSMKKLFEIQCNKPDWPVQFIMDMLNTILYEWFLMRLANEKLNWGMDWLDSISCLYANELTLTLDHSTFIEKLLGKNNRLDHQDEFTKTINSYRKYLQNNPRYQIHGHDFIDLLSWFLHKSGIKKELNNQKTILRALVLATESSTLLNENNIKKIFPNYSETPSYLHK